MNLETGNILDKKFGIICHQVNCQLVMGAGLAKQIRALYPRVYTEYKSVMGRVTPQQRLGMCQLVHVLVNPSLFIANLFGQFHYLPRRVRHTDYTALTMAFKNLDKWLNQLPEHHRPPVYIPYGIGCGLAGGDWKQVHGIIKDVVPYATIVRYNGR